MSKIKRGTVPTREQQAFQKRTVLAMIDEMVEAREKLEQSFVMFTALAKSMGVLVASSAD